MEKKCGCKGCRSCLLCESIDKKAAKQNLFEKNQFYTFFYNRHSGHCIGQVVATGNDLNEEVKSLIGFDFPGVTIVSNFLSISEEANLVKEIDKCQWKISQSGRCKQDYGPKVNFKKQKIKLSTFTGLPAYISEMGIVGRMKELSLLRDFDVVELCNLEYVPERGSHIEPHFDDAWLWGERLVTLNLLSDSWLTMSCDADEFCQLHSYSPEKVDKAILQQLSMSSVSVHEKRLSKNVIKVKIPLQRYSLVILYGPARHKWKHAIERKDIVSRRLCCTFRELSQLFLDGEKIDIGKEVLVIASSFNGSVVL